MLDITVFFLLLHLVGIGIFLFLKPKAASLILILTCIFSLGYFSRWFGITRYLDRLPYLLGILLAVRLTFDILNKKISFTDKNIIKTLFYFFIFLLFLTIFSLLYNGENFILGLFELRYYFLLIILFLCIYFYFPGQCTVNRFIKTLIIIGLIQIPFTIMEYLSVKLSAVNFIPSALDRSSGTFSSYEALVFFQCVVIAVPLVYQMKFNKPIFKINNYILSVVLTIPFVFSFSRSATIFVIVSIFIIATRQLYVEKKFKLSTVFMVLFIMIIMVSSFYFMFWKQHSLENQLNTEYIVNYIFRMPKDYQAFRQGEHTVMGRARAVYESFNHVLKSSGQALLGTGSGSTSEASLLNLSGRNFYSYGSLAGLGRTQISSIIAEFGFIGFFLFIWLLISLYRKVKTVNVENNNLLMDIYIIILINLTLNIFYSKLFQFPVALFLLAYFMAVLQRYLPDRKESWK